MTAADAEFFFRPYPEMYKLQGMTMHKYVWRNNGRHFVNVSCLHVQRV